MRGMNQNEKGYGREAEQKVGFERYAELGGRISREDYFAVLKQEAETKELRKSTLVQLEQYTKRAGVEMETSGEGGGRLSVLYAALREVNPKIKGEAGVGDQGLVVEALRILDREDDVEKMKAAYPNMKFD